MSLPSQMTFPLHNQERHHKISSWHLDHELEMHSGMLLVVMLGKGNTQKI